MMDDQRPKQAVIADMDGVLTQTATLHERAWKRVFDEFLAEPQAPFSSEDYRAHVDGKPRYDGVADFLVARGIELERGQPSDPPSAETVHGLGNRKNALFLELLEHEGAKVFTDAVVVFERWRRGGLKLAVVSASRNCRAVLESLDTRVFAEADVIVDGVTSAELVNAGKPGGKRGLLLEAARRLEVEVGEAVVLEDAESGVRAGREAGFGLVVGVARDGHGHGHDHGQALTRAGAHELISDLYGLRFARRIPSALACREALARWQGERGLAVFLDYDGTLSPIVDDPGAAVLPEPTRSTIAALAERCPVAIVSGRDRPDVEERVGIAGLLYAGGHGFDIAGRGHQKVLPEAEAAVPAVDHAEHELRRTLAEIPGAIVERKRFSVAAHYRQVEDDTEVETVIATVEALATQTGLRMRSGKKVVELEPALAWDKGRAVDWILSVLQIDRSRQPLIYIGDDETDEDVFSALHGDGLGVRVGSEVSDSLADYRVADTDEVRELLAWLIGRC